MSEGHGGRPLKSVSMNVVFVKVARLFLSTRPNGKVVEMCAKFSILLQSVDLNKNFCDVLENTLFPVSLRAVHGPRARN